MKEIKTFSLSLMHLLLVLLLFACNKDKDDKNTPAQMYSVSGSVIDEFGRGMQGVKIYYSSSLYALTDSLGNWEMDDLSGENSLAPAAEQYSFEPISYQVSAVEQNIVFSAERVPSNPEAKIFNWMRAQQLPNGLLESAEYSNVASTYDNALAAMCFLMIGEPERAERIFDFFDARIFSELKSGPGGFSQLRSNTGVPNNHRWMGDNAWLLIALNNYKAMTGNAKYDFLSSEIATWLIGLQDIDGGLFAGYDRNNNRLNYKVTEGMIDAFNAIEGYTAFHRNLLQFLEIDRWDATDGNLTAWPGNPPYLFALDVFPWSYLIFEDYPVSALTSADRFLCSHTAINGVEITGYCFDEDKDVVWPEGTGQMTLAFHFAGRMAEKELYLNELERILLQNSDHLNAAGFPYATNMGTTYGPDPLWNGADTEIALSGGAWYLFTKFGFSPFAHGRSKNIPQADKFWLQ